MRPFVGAQAGGIVTSHFETSGAVRCSAVIFARDHVVCCGKSAFEVRPHRRDEDDKQVFVGWADAHLRTCADKQRANIESGTAFVGRNETFIEFHDTAHHFHENFRRKFGHQDATAGALHAGCIVGKAEGADTTIGAAESFLPFEALLSVVQTGGCHVQIDGFGRRYFDFAPFAVAIIATYVVVGGHVAEGQVGPVDIFHAYT